MTPPETPSSEPLVLVLEDDGLWRRIIRHTLAKQGVRVVEATTCADAIDACRAERFDLALLDYELPDGCGLDVLDAIDRSGLGRVVLASGSVDGTDLGDHRCRLVDRFLTKPFLSSDLVACLEGVGAGVEPVEVI